MSQDNFYILLPLEKKFLESKGYLLSKNVFDEDICSREPGRSGDYNCAISMVARLFGYRDGHDREFQKARNVYGKLTQHLEYFI